MSLLGARRERREAERAAWREEGMRLRPVERRFGRLPAGRWLYLCGGGDRKEVAWTDEEALAALQESERGVLFRLPSTGGYGNPHKEFYNLYLINRRIYESQWKLAPEDLLRATVPASPYLPIVQIERENDDDRLGTRTYHESGRPQQLGEPSKFQPVEVAAPLRVRKPIPKSVKMFVWQRDGGRCVQCGSQERLEFDHIIPWADGGSDTERNLQLLCEPCNRRKGRNL